MCTGCTGGSATSTTGDYRRTLTATQCYTARKVRGAATAHLGEGGGELETKTLGSPTTGKKKLSRRGRRRGKDLELHLVICAGKGEEMSSWMADSSARSPSWRG